MPTPLQSLVLFFGLFANWAVAADELIARALQAENSWETETALQLLLQAEKRRPDDAFILQKIARQYSDSIEEQPNKIAKIRRAHLALDYARRAVELEPNNAVNVLSVAITHGKLAVLSSTREKVRYAWLIKQNAERAIELDPDYAWAHHVLGRWHRELSALGPTARWFARLLFGEIPPASLKEAVAQFQRAIELDPENPNHHIELGFTYLAIGQESDAQRQFELGLSKPSVERYDEQTKEYARRALGARG